MAGTDGGGYAAGSYDGRVGVQFWPNAKPKSTGPGMTKQQEQLGADDKLHERRPSAEGAEALAHLQQQLQARVVGP